MSIQVNNVYAGPFYGALIGMRNSFNSWKMSDSVEDKLLTNAYASKLEEPITDGFNWEYHECRIPGHESDDPKPIIGAKDSRLISNLIKSGEPHCKFLRQIPVIMDITAPLYWWKQMDTYKVGTTANSTSTMHTIMSAPLTAEDFSFEDCSYDALSRRMANEIRVNLNTLIGKYNRSNDLVEMEHLFNAVVQLLPESYNQMRTWSGNYSILRNIYAQRKHHKLREWREFCDLLKNLPLSWMITVGLDGGVSYAEIENG